ncbi:MAG: hypothetical protein KME06_02395 [Kastovskya adunca ATA6-11-RM4]|nr:hypothetical protein [Kastovskya adunca ATA6-11-RM4]
MQHLLMSEFIQSELRKALRPRQSTPNLALTKVPIDQNLSFELWTPRWVSKINNFTPLEIELIRRETPRITRILSKLTWLMGAICIGEDDWMVGDRQSVRDWDSVIEFVKVEGRCVNPIPTKVVYSPHSLIPIYDSDRKQEGIIPPQAWEICPSRWTIIFDDLVPVGKSFRLKQSEDFISVEIWTGKPTRREVRNGKIYVEYRDIYASTRK